MSSRTQSVALDAITGEQIEALLASIPSEHEKPALPKLTPVESLKIEHRLKPVAPRGKVQDKVALSFATFIPPFWERRAR